jgi:hypothetical protein
MQCADKPCSETIERDSVRAALAAYLAALGLAEDLDARRSTLLGVPAATTRFVAAHLRASARAMMQTPQSRIALGRDIDNSTGLLSDLEHFEQALPPSPSTLRRTVIVVAVLGVVELLARASLTPLEVRNPGMNFPLVPLTRALDLNPGDVADAFDRLLHASLSSVSALIATVALSIYLVLRPSVFAYSRKRLILCQSRRLGIRPGGRHLARCAWRLNVSEAETRAFAALSVKSRPPDHFDLAVKAALATTGLALGIAWMIAYWHGFSDSIGITDATGVVESSSFTDRPLWLLLVGCLLAELGVLRYSYLVGELRARLAGAPRVANLRQGLGLLQRRPVILPFVLGTFATGAVLAGGVWLEGREYPPPLTLTASVINPDVLATRQLPVTVSCGRIPCYVVDASLARPLRNPDAIPGPSPAKVIATGYSLNVPLDNRSGIASPIVRGTRTLRLGLPRGAVQAMSAAARQNGLTYGTWLAIDVEGVHTGDRRTGEVEIYIGHVTP